MAGKPRGQQVKIVLAIFILPGFFTGLSGCELGRTMFQYSSGSGSPWVGIDLLPRKKKKSPTKISHQETITSDSQKSQDVQVALQKEPVVTKFSKKPIRLNLPSSKSTRKSNKLLETEVDIEPLTPDRIFDF